MTAMLQFFNWLRGKSKKKGNEMIIQYVRDLEKNPVGVVVATGPDKVGWSVCHPKDHWDKVKALNIAVGRAESGKQGPIPHRNLGTEVEVLDDGLVVETNNIYLEDELLYVINRVAARSLKAF